MKYHCYSCFLIILVIIFGCAPKTYRINNEFDTYCKSINSYCLINPDIEICEVSAGGVVEIRDDWCSQGLDNVLTTLEEALSKNRVNYKRVIIDDDLKNEINEIQALYRAVSYSIRIHSIGPSPQVFPSKSKSFDYSIGPINSICKRYDCDGIIIVYGTDAISSAGRKTLMFLGAIAGAFTGVVIMPSAGISTINFALIDEDGNILFYNSKAKAGYDLRKLDSARKLVNEVLSEYPECIK